MYWAGEGGGKGIACDRDLQRVNISFLGASVALGRAESEWFSWELEIVDCCATDWGGGIDGSGGTSLKSMVSSTRWSLTPMKASKTVAEAAVFCMLLLVVTSYRSVVIMVVEDELTTLLLLAFMCVVEWIGTDCSNIVEVVVNGFDRSDTTAELKAPESVRNCGAEELGSSGTASNGFSDEEAVSLVAEEVTSWETTVEEYVSKDEVVMLVADDADTDDVIVLFSGFAVVSNSEMFNWANSCD